MATYAVILDTDMTYWIDLMIQFQYSCYLATAFIKDIYQYYS